MGTVAPLPPLGTLGVRGGRRVLASPSAIVHSAAKSLAIAPCFALSLVPSPCVLIMAAAAAPSHPAGLEPRATLAAKLAAAHAALVQNLSLSSTGNQEGHPWTLKSDKDGYVAHGVCAWCSRGPLGTLFVGPARVADPALARRGHPRTLRSERALRCPVSLAGVLSSPRHASSLSRRVTIYTSKSTTVKPLYFKTTMFLADVSPAVLRHCMFDM